MYHFRLHKRKNRPQNHGPAIDESQSELCNEPRGTNVIVFYIVIPRLIIVSHKAMQNKKYGTIE